MEENSDVGLDSWRHIPDFTYLGAYLWVNLSGEPLQKTTKDDPSADESEKRP